MISYAQNYEDVMLARAFKDQKTGFYIDIGAMDPVEGSVTKHFYDLGWNGINIEPDQRFLERLRQDRPRDINLNVALGAKPDRLNFHIFEEQGISTFNPEFAEYFLERGKSHRVVKYPVTTLAEICIQHVHQQIDFLKIDAEGWEGPILEGADLDKFRPIIVVFEATMPYSHLPAWAGSEPHLLNAGYELAYFDGLNRFYVRRESLVLKEAFRYPPCVLDDYKPYSQVSSELALADSQKKLAEFQQTCVESERALAESRGECGVLQERVQVLEDEQNGLLQRLSAIEQNTAGEREAAEAHAVALRHEVEHARSLAVKLTQQHASWRARIEDGSAELNAATARIQELERTLAQEQYERRAQVLQCLLGPQSKCDEGQA